MQPQHEHDRQADTSVARGATAAAGSPTRTGVALGALMGPSALGVTAAAVAVPEAASSLGASPIELHWALSAYIVCLAVASALGGRLMAVVGGTSVLKLGSAVLAAGAVGTLVAPTVTGVAVSRAVLAAGAGLLAGLALGLVGETAADRRPRVLAAFAAVMAAFVGAGPLLGGLLAPSSWRLIFASPVLSLLAGPVASRAAAAVRRRAAATLDPLGLLWAVLASGGLIVVLQAAATSATWTTLVLLGAVTVLGAVASTRHVRTHPDGFLPQAVVARRDLAGWWVAALGAQAGQVGALVLVPVTLADAHRSTTGSIGLALALVSLGGVWSSRSVAKHVDAAAGVRSGAALALLLAVSLVGASIAEEPWALLLAGFLGFAAFSAVQVVAMHHVAGRVPDDVVAAASGILSLVFLVGGAIGSSVASLAASWVGFGDAAAVVAAAPLAAAVAAFALARRVEPPEDPAQPDPAMMRIIHRAFRRDVTRLAALAAARGADDPAVRSGWVLLRAQLPGPLRLLATGPWRRSYRRRHPLSDVPWAEPTATRDDIRTRQTTTKESPTMSPTSKIAIIYYSATGTVHRLAEAVVVGAEKAGAEVRLRRVPEVAPREAIESNPEWAAHIEATASVPEARLDDLVWADGVILGSGTRFGLPASQLKQFIDRTGPLWAQGKLADKVYSSFTSTSTRHGGQESTLLALNNTFYHWGGYIVPPGYTDPIQFRTGNPYGVGHVTDNGATPPGDTELLAAEYLGRRVAEVSSTLVAGRAAA